MQHGTNVEKNHKQLERNHITSKSKKPIKSEHLEINEQFHELPYDSWIVDGKYKRSEKSDMRHVHHGYRARNDKNISN
jgi:hypothetical protein